MVYQQGQFIDQYTVTFATSGKKNEIEQAIVKLRFSSKLFKDLIHFQVELNSIPIADKH